MSELIAKPIIKNKFWVVEESGQKIATIQAVDDGGIVYVHNDQRKKYASVKILSKQHNIKFVSTIPRKKDESINQVYGYPIKGKSFNEMFDVKRKLPIYTKTQKSRSQYCAGYYLIKTSQCWTKVLCPKNISVNRYPYIGPFSTEEETLTALKEINNATT